MTTNEELIAKFKACRTIEGMVEVLTNFTMEKIESFPTVEEQETFANKIVKTLTDEI